MASTIGAYPRTSICQQADSVQNLTVISMGGSAKVDCNYIIKKLR
jgi:hypothetical protein